MNKELDEYIAVYSLKKTIAFSVLSPTSRTKFAYNYPFIILPSVSISFSPLSSPIKYGKESPLISPLAFLLAFPSTFRLLTSASTIKNIKNASSTLFSLVIIPLKISIALLSLSTSINNIGNISFEYFMYRFGFSNI